MITNKPAIVEQIRQARLVAIFRGDYRGKWLDYAHALMIGGVSILEITLNSAGALTAIADLKRELGDQITLGAGTVLSAEGANAAIDAGAQFIVAPDTDKNVMEVAKARGIAVMPGAFTATEVKQAYLLGADMVKLFPA
jgi:2-dehydro-3-deoxyphosphogluconate aldolase / (4S)-4-hydroxy-2-oxoglutarate aldolase